MRDSMIRTRIKEHVSDCRSPLMDFVRMPSKDNSLGNDSLWVRIREQSSGNEFRFCVGSID